MNKITYADKVAINENTEIPDINKVTDSDMNEIKNVVNDFISGDDYLTSTPTLMNATVTYTVQKCRYKYINEKVIVGSVIVRGKITNVLSPGYARIKCNIPNFTSISMDESFGVIQEAFGATDEQPYSAVIGYEDNSIIIGLERTGGIGVCSWVNTTQSIGIYIKIGFIITR